MREKITSFGTECTYPRDYKEGSNDLSCGGPICSWGLPAGLPRRTVNILIREHLLKVHNITEEENLN